MKDIERGIADHVSECIRITDVATWQVLYVNPAFERIWGMTCNDLRENPHAWTDRIHAADRRRVTNAFFKYATEGSYQEEFRIVLPDGFTRWIVDRGVLLRDEQGNRSRLVGIAEEITQRVELERQVAEISSYERQRISQDLHDALGQQLTGLGFLAKGLAGRLADVSPIDVKTAEDILQGMQQAMSEVRHVVNGLAPVDIDLDGLAVALQNLASQVSSQSDAACIFECPRPVAATDNNVSTQLFRIAQEAVNNAVKHSGASCIRIKLQATDGVIELAIHDNGTQKPAQFQDGSGMGLRIMQYRSRSMGGSLKIHSEAEGTTVACSLSMD